MNRKLLTIEFYTTTVIALIYLFILGMFAFVVGIQEVRDDFWEGFRFLGPLVLCLNGLYALRMLHQAVIKPSLRITLSKTLILSYVSGVVGIISAFPKMNEFGNGFVVPMICLIFFLHVTWCIRHQLDASKL